MERFVSRSRTGRRNRAARGFSSQTLRFLARAGEGHGVDSAARRGEPRMLASRLGSGAVLATVHRVRGELRRSGALRAVPLARLGLGKERTRGEPFGSRDGGELAVALSREPLGKEFGLEVWFLWQKSLAWPGKV